MLNLSKCLFARSAGVIIAGLWLSSSTAAAELPAPELTPAAAAHFARLALDCVDREYPNKIALTMQGDEDLAPPRDLHPAFFGCFDWHSSVHGHWLLARLARRFPDADFAADARLALDRSLTPAKISAEVNYLEAEGRATFERPYGLAWLLQLAAELRVWDNPQARRWSENLVPLETLAAERFMGWLPRLRYPIRTGEHSQTAFALGLVHDWSTVAGADSLAGLLEERARFYHLDDTGCNLAYEPSGQDFLSPCLAEADLMRRVLAPPRFAAWLSEFLPEIPTATAAGHHPSAWLPVAEVTDRSDGKLAHLDGLNLSRAWMLYGIATGLPEDDPRLAAILAAAGTHREIGLAAVDGEFYEGGHWLASFAVYLVTADGADQ